MALAKQDITHNHAKYQDRLDFIEQLFRERFGVSEPVEITPIQYDLTCPFKYNNFIYRITLKSPLGPHQRQSQQLQPGCVLIPESTTTFLLRLTNAHAEGLSQTSRVENEVCMLFLASSALSSIKLSIIPHIYAWQSASPPSPQGWILQEFMPGRPLDELLPSMTISQKRNVFAQAVSILKALQDFELPHTIKGFGGVMFDHQGEIVSAEMTTVGAGPWEVYEEYFRARFDAALREADRTAWLGGWRERRVRERLDAFMKDGLAPRIRTLGLEEKVISHLDFTPNNILISPSTHRITALIDWDFSAILHPIQEFLHSFSGFGESLTGYSLSESIEDAVVRRAKIHGFSSPLSILTPSYSDSESSELQIQNKTVSALRWQNLTMWEDALVKANVKRPSTMEGVEGAADVEALLGMVAPWKLCNGDALERMSQDAILKCRRESEEILANMLAHLGY
ncbi:hypothetical protein DL98DRAFT_632021 [Cadophora sp. DSE1049]|nr:hypothetical protein DL98DRAFT_632021 [Cadophora sp. DSE1049]